MCLQEWQLYDLLARFGDSLKHVSELKARCKSLENFLSMDTDQLPCPLQIAIELVPSVKLLRNTGNITGHVALRLSNLTARGYIVVLITCSEWRALDPTNAAAAAAAAAAGAAMLAGSAALQNPFASAAEAQEKFLAEVLSPHLQALQAW